MCARRTPNLKRRRHTREPKQRFVVYCEGGNTEPAYLDALRRACDALIEVETVPAVGVPYTVAERATARARVLRRNSKNSFEKGDQVWALFDRDTHPRFTEAIQLCEDRSVFVGRSIPCFELWLILHEQDFDRPDGHEAVQAHLRMLRPEYARDKRKTPNCADLVKRVEIAEERAERQLARREQEGAPYGSPSTTVGRLTRAIREAAALSRSK